VIGLVWGERELGLLGKGKEVQIEVDNILVHIIQSAIVYRISDIGDKKRT